jgi:hypothetical protein
VSHHEHPPAASSLRIDPVALNPERLNPLPPKYVASAPITE